MVLKLVLKAEVFCLNRWIFTISGLSNFEWWNENIRPIQQNTSGLFVGTARL
jgi:hypothetical protein